MFAEVYVAVKISNLPYNEQIRRAREQKNLTQKGLAKKVGVSSSYISKVEKGIEVPTIERAKELAESLKPFISKRALLRKILEKQGIKGEDLFIFKKFFAKVKKCFT